MSSAPLIDDITLTPVTGPAPLTVSADVVIGRNYAPEEAPRSYRWDFDGDGLWETSFSTESLAEFTFESTGNYEIKVQILDTFGESAVFSLADPVVVTASVTPHADIRIDTNRDGELSHVDDIGEDYWQQHRGAIIPANLDDDDNDGEQDGKDRIINGSGDTLDMMPLRIEKIAGLSANHTGTFQVYPLQADKNIRIYTTQGEIIRDINQGAVTFNISALSQGSVTYWVESVSGRAPNWPGNATLSFQVFDGASLVTHDVVSFRVAPVILPDNTRPARNLYVMKIDDSRNSTNLPFVQSLQNNLPPSVNLYTIDEYTYGADRWLQDSMQTGYQQYPGAQGAPMVVQTHLQTQRQTGPQGLEALLPKELLRANLGYSYPGGTASSHNSGGNLEVAPPHPGFPFGRLLVGGGDQGTLWSAPNYEHMAVQQKSWLDAQEVQGPTLELSSEWLAVGHIDEIFLAVPSTTLPGTWKYVLASPDMAIAALQELATQGQGQRIVFAGRETETTVSELLANEELMSYNTLAQARVDMVRLRLMEEIGLSEDDFLEVPVMMEPLWYQGWDMGIALNPGIQNLVVADVALFVPDPEGPNGVWKAQTQASLAELGHTLHFVDVFDSYHLLMGEAHCGTNVERDPFESIWWEEK
jgi:hypothetical protein